MFIPDWMLKKLVESRELISFEEKDEQPVLYNPASIDLRLSRWFVLLSGNGVQYELGGIGWNRWLEQETFFLADRVKLLPGDALLASTVEIVKIPDQPFQVHTELGEVTIPACTGQLFLKSSAARRGLDHALAGWVDPGFTGQLTLELHAHREVVLEAGKPYVQLAVAGMVSFPEKSYRETGRYVNQLGPTMAKEATDVV